MALAVDCTLAGISGREVTYVCAMGRLNMAAASATLGDTEHGRRVREVVTAERAIETAVLDELGLPHTASAANFVFFDAKRPHTLTAEEMRSEGVQVARASLPYDRWVRGTIGGADENRVAQEPLRKASA